jgi:signal transduction histidine kinase
MKSISTAFCLRLHKMPPGAFLCRPTFSYFLIFIVSVVFFACSNADDTIVKKTLPAPQHKADSTLIAGLLDTAFRWQGKNNDSCNYYATRAIQLAREKKFPLAEAEANCRFANVAEDTGNYSAALKHFYSALALDSIYGNADGVGREHYQISILMKKLGNYAESEYNAKRAMNIWRTIPGKENKVGLAAISLGNIYMRQGKADFALDFFQQADSIAGKTGSISLQADAMNGIGLIYEMQQRYDKAIAMYQQSLAFGEKNSLRKVIANASNNIGNIYYLQNNFSKSLEWYQRSMQLYEEIGYTEKITNTLSNIGSIYAAQGDLEKALDYHIKSYRIQSERDDQQEMAISANNIGLDLRLLGREKEAARYFDTALSITQKTGGKAIELEMLNNLSESSASMGNYLLALDYSRRLSKLRDTIDERIRKADEIEELYREAQTQRKLVQKENEKAYAETERNKAESSKRELQVYALTVGIVLLIALFLALWKFSREKHRAIVAEQQEKINRQKTEDVIRNQELIVLRSIFDAQEKERQRIAKDLHDRLGLKLSTARLYYNLVGKLAAGMNEEERKQYDNGNNILNEASNELREVAHDLVSGEIMRFGLSPAVERLCETLQEASGLKIDFYSSGLDDRIDSYSEFQIYQIIQELLTNIHRHAKATHATIQFSRYNHTLNVIVEDNGVGFPEKEGKQGNGIGLQNVQERVLKLNGSLQIDSKPGRGTTISIDITIP